MSCVSIGGRGRGSARLWDRADWRGRGGGFRGQRESTSEAKRIAQGDRRRHLHLGLLTLSNTTAEIAVGLSMCRVHSTPGVSPCLRKGGGAGRNIQAVPQQQKGRVARTEPSLLSTRGRAPSSSVKLPSVSLAAPLPARGVGHPSAQDSAFPACSSSGIRTRTELPIWPVCFIGGFVGCRMSWLGRHEWQ